MVVLALIGREIVGARLGVGVVLAVERVGAAGVPAHALVAPAQGDEPVALARVEGVVVVARIGVVETVDRVARGGGHPADALQVPTGRGHVVALGGVGSVEVLAGVGVVEAIHLDARIVLRREVSLAVLRIGLLVGGLLRALLGGHAVLVGGKSFLVGAIGILLTLGLVLALIARGALAVRRRRRGLRGLPRQVALGRKGTLRRRYHGRHEDGRKERRQVLLPHAHAYPQRSAGYSPVCVS